MNKKFTEDDIKKALEQADANQKLEEAFVPTLEKEKTKVIRKELKNDSRRS